MTMHSFDVDVAKAVGTNAAIILQNLWYLQQSHQTRDTKDFYHDGRWWVSFTIEQFNEWHPYFSIQTIRTTLKKLEESGHLLKATYGKNAWDRTTYWSVTGEIAHLLKLTNGVVRTNKSDLLETTNVLHDNNIKTNKKFIPPTVDEVSKYITEKGYSIDPEAFVAHYEANGWYRGKSKVKCWKSCVTTWVKNSKPSTTKAYI